MAEPDVRLTGRLGPAAVDATAARAQWRDLLDLLLKHHRVHLLPGRTDAPFMGDAALAGPGRLGGVFVAGRPGAGRAEDVAAVSRWLRGHDHRRLLWTAAGPLACGDLAWSDGLLLGGHGVASSQPAVRAVGKAFGRHVIPLRLADGRWPTLDHAFCPVGDGALHVPEAFDAAGRDALASLHPRLEAVPEAGCLVADGRAYVQAGADETAAAVRRLGAEPVPVDLSAWRSVGGTPASMACRLWD